VLVFVDVHRWRERWWSSTPLSALQGCRTHGKDDSYGSRGLAG
jgi:hypothetical protein